MRIGCLTAPDGPIVVSQRNEAAWVVLGPASTLTDWLSSTGLKVARERVADPTACTLDVPADQVWLPPLASGARIFCVGINYKSHAGETGRDLPAQPSLFIRTQESIVGAHRPLRMPTASTHFDYEGELAVVVGSLARDVSTENALACVAGYTCFNDGSVRDFQKHSVTAGKNFDESGACGPWLVTADEVPDPSSLTLVTRLNGSEVQRSSTSFLIYPVPQILSYLSTITGLRPGDVIATGTPAGVGARRDPPLWMRSGSQVEVEIEGVGLLANRVE
jgi:2-keto-4-pentenoate hydratase/2-oxohepta-3-ene-1,7-dioic acid hydratase in catechol pathway